jgi:hypothetical protein
MFFLTQLFALGFRRPAAVAARALLALTAATAWMASTATAQVAPTITTPPASQVAVVGTNVTFSVVAAGTAPLAYQWLKSGTNIDAATNSTYSFTIPDGTAAGSYSVRVSNATGAVVSAPAVLTVNVPAIFSTSPADQIVYLGQLATFSAVPAGNTPISIQWYFGATVLTNATNGTLVVGPVDFTNAGVYTAAITNAYGGTSAYGLLTVLALPDPAIRLDTPRFSESGAVFPVLYTGHSTETNVSFSVGFDPAVYTNVAFAPASTDGVSWSSDVSQLAAGALGVTGTYAGTTKATPGETLIGNFSATLVSGASNRFAGKVGLTGVPSPLAFAPSLVSTNSTNSAQLVTNSTIQLLGPTPPVFVGTAPAPVLNPQTGLLEQPVSVSNPGPTLLGGTFVTVSGLGVDSRTNSILLQNAQVYLTTGAAVVDSGSIAPGEIRRILLEYYVSDRVTVPAPTLAAYGASLTLATPTNGTVLNVITNRFVPQGFLVEFATRSDRRYYVQYADHAADFSGTNATAIFTALPAVPGTGGSVQWLDNGPPKTRSVPAAGARFYRVLETQ